VTVEADGFHYVSQIQQSLMRFYLAKYESVVHSIRSLRGRDFRFLWISDICNSLAEQMEFVVLSWFVLIETDSPFWVGVFVSLRFAGTLFAPFYGVLADRYNRKYIFLGVRTSFIILSAIILYVSLTDGLEIWHTFVLVSIFGCARAFDGVMRETVLADLVQKEGLGNAAALTRMARDVTQMLGPIIGGFMLSQYDMNYSYSIIVIIYSLAVISGYMIKHPVRCSATSSRSILRDMSQSLTYIVNHRLLLALLSIYVVLNGTAFTTNHGLMTIFSLEVLETGSTGLGILLGTYSAGALVGSISVAILPNIQRPGKVFMIGTWIWYIMILAVSQVIWFGASLPLFALAGFSQSVVMVMLTILILTESGEGYRGSVMGVRHLAVYGLPIGMFISGSLAGIGGAPLALIINSLTGMLIIFLMQVSGFSKNLWIVRH